MSRRRAAAALALSAAALGAGGCGGEERSASATQTPRAADAELLAAADAGDLAGVRHALAAGASVRTRDDGGATALVRAAYGNHVEVARALVRAGADVNVQDETQQSAYLIATSEVGDDPRLLELALANGADVDAKDSFNGTGLIRAGERGYPRIVARLLRAGIDRDHVNRLGWTALLEAIVLGDGEAAHIRTVRALVRGGVDVNIPDGDGVRPLTHARERGYDEIARLLEAAGARS